MTIRATLAAALALFVVAVQPAQADPVPTAVLPFELATDRTAGGLAPEPDPAEVNRLGLATAKLTSMLTESGKYKVLDISSLKDDLEKASPIYDCNGCEIELAKKVGATLVATGKIHKSTSTLINISIFIRDVASGELTNSMAVSIRENDDAGWQRGVRSLVRNRLLAKER